MRHGFKKFSLLKEEPTTATDSTMNHKMQFGNFTHGKCLNCGFLAQIDRFNSKPYERVVFTEIKVNGDATVDAFAFVLECPKCSSLNTEALFVDEVN